MGETDPPKNAKFRVFVCFTALFQTAVARKVLVVAEIWDKARKTSRRDTQLCLYEFLPYIESLWLKKEKNVKFRSPQGNEISLQTAVARKVLVVAENLKPAT